MNFDQNELNFTILANVRCNIRVLVSQVKFHPEFRLDLVCVNEEEKLIFTITQFAELCTFELYTACGIGDGHHLGWRNSSGRIQRNKASIYHERLLFNVSFQSRVPTHQLKYANEICVWFQLNNWYVYVNKYVTWLTNPFRGVLFWEKISKAEILLFFQKENEQLV